MNRMSRCAALIGTVLSLSSFAQVCQEVSLYKNGSEIGKMEENNRTFPESPEWGANWGNLGEMVPPYIRLSGQRDVTSDWTGEFSFGNLPVNVSGGNLKVKLRSTQEVSAKVWLTGNFGKSSSHTVNMEKDRTYSLEVPVSGLVGTGVKSVSRIGIGLVKVPAYQYTTLFVDDIAFTCGVVSENTSLLQGSSGEAVYPYSDIQPENAARPAKFRDALARETSAAYSPQERRLLSDSTNMDFVVDLFEHAQIKRYETATDLTPKQSSRGWFSALHKLEVNRLRDSVIANPKELLFQAEAYAASSDKKAVPLLLGNVDYGYRSCADSSCKSQVIRPARLLLAGLPTSVIHGSVFRIFYDPYFLTTNRAKFPAVEVKIKGTWEVLAPKSEKEIQFESAGVQKIQVRLTEGGIITTQTLFVEVK